MIAQGELEAHYNPPALQVAEYRRLWLDDAHTLGLIAETLADALAWQPTSEQPLPDPLELAGAVAGRITSLEKQLDAYRPRLKARHAAREYA